MRFLLVKFIILNIESIRKVVCERDKCTAQNKEHSRPIIRKRKKYSYECGAQLLLLIPPRGSSAFLSCWTSRNQPPNHERSPLEKQLT
jgi:hypothetical protein